MKKAKILYSLGALGVATLFMPILAAFEAHVVNVTAQIENALGVSTEAIDFGTVFPQEHLDQPLGIRLSQSFLDEDRVDDVNYFIRQKPKCGITTNDGQTLVGPTATGHVGLDAEDRVVIDCGEPPRPLVTGEVWGVLPSLCEYISKEDDQTPDNDGSLASFHQPYRFEGRQLIWNDTPGRLAKSEQDTVDNWNIDLAVPCFGGHCAQDWADFVHGINPNADPALYTQPISNEHKVFGCDLWVEVNGVSRPGTLTVNKTIVPGGSALSPAEFSFQVDAGAPTPFEADGSNNVVVISGSHVVSEPVVASGYIPTFSGDCDAAGNVTVPANGSATCTITNTPEAAGPTNTNT